MILTVPQESKPNSVYLVGDVHGFTGTYLKFIERLPDGQRTIQLGDMGLGFKGVGLKRMADCHTWFRGNHDDPEKCQWHPNYRGDYGYEASSGIFHIAGAWSIDRDMRIEGLSWWRDEELSYEELQKVIDLYKRIKPRFVVSHEAPAKAASVMLHSLSGAYFSAKLDCSKSRTSEAMQTMLEVHQPEKWIFGHYHVDKEFYTPGFDTQFVCVGGMMNAGELPHVYELQIEAMTDHGCQVAMQTAS